MATPVLKRANNVFERRSRRDNYNKGTLAAKMPAIQRANKVFKGLLLEARVYACNIKQLP